MVTTHRALKLAVGVLVLAGSVARGGPVAGDETRPPAERLPASLRAIRARVEERVRSGKVPSLAVGVIKDGELVWDEAFGWADRERKIKATGDTLYPVASVSKALTATGVFLLAQRGQLKLDGPVEDYLGAVRLKSLRARPRPPTLRDVLGMTAGIPHYAGYRWAGESAPTPTTAALIERHGFIAFAPGKHFHYSNLSYAVAEQVIAEVSGAGFEDFMRREVFGPLGMDRTLLKVPAGLQEHVARPYDSDNRRASDFDFSPKGGAGFYSTAHDLLRFARFHLGQPRQKVLRAATLAAIHRPAGPATAGPPYANGWGVLDTGDPEPTLLSNGEFLGAAATVVLLPARRAAVVCLTNVNGSPRVSDDFAFQVADALAPGFAKKLSQAEAAAEKLDQARQPPAKLAGRWEGHVQTAGRSHLLRLRVGPDGKVSVGLRGDREVPLEQARFDGAVLVGSFRGTWPVPDAGRAIPRVELELVKDGDVLEGVAGMTFRGGGLVQAAVLLRRQ
jgi:CubicO group peptidase (beta-lactamase class C family)